LMLLDLAPFGLTGRQGETMIREAGITLNRNSLPFDTNGPWYTSGLRIGTPAITTLGMGPEEMREIAAVLKVLVSHTKPSPVTTGPNAGTISKARYEVEPKAMEEARSRVAALLSRFPVYPNLDLECLEELVGE
ncbi:MAG: glycine hydroxymethyltransferase, partial [Armatimonadota bacterium]|nr:glycine hydroxymethyltransferase [Armatimonadota bacterium]